MGYKALYKQLKKSKRILLYGDNIHLWRDYLPSDIKLLWQYKYNVDNPSNYIENPLEIYYSKKRGEYYVKVIFNYIGNTNCRIEVYDRNLLVEYIVKNELYNTLNNNLKHEFGFLKKI